MQKNCRLEKVDHETYDIFVLCDKIGRIWLERKTEEVCLHVEIAEPYRKMGYASKAVGQFTHRMHETYPYIHAVITQEEDRMRHILEHNGYERVAKQGEKLLYVHHDVQTQSDVSYVTGVNEEVLYLAGGCFWGLEKAFRLLKGVSDTCVGYANGTLQNPTYEQVCHQETNAKETVRVTFAKEILPLVLQAYFACINPEQKDGQGEDIGSQYQTGVYYKNAALKEPLEDFFLEEKKKYKAFYVECKPLDSFWIAEEYHQNYLTKIADGYCHIHTEEIEKIKELQEKFYE